MESSSVLIVGGGLVGLSAAVFLAARGVATVLVERHAGSSPLPRAMGFTTRTMELYRAVGLGDRIPQVPRGWGRPRRVRVESLAGKWASEEVPWTPAGEITDADPPVEYSICTGAAIAQDRLEPILRARAIELGADIRLATSLLSFEQDAAGVTAQMRHRDGHAYAFRADYVIAADGHASPIREAMGIGRDGQGVLRTARSILFHAALDEYRASGISQFEIEQPGLEGMLTTYRDASQGAGRWLLIVADDRDHDEQAMKALIQRAVGRTDFAIEIIATGLWELSALIAKRFAQGRIFLAGDAAHTLPPARGGYGANTGIEDVHNLAWKLGSVLSGASTPALLDSYDAERRPIAWLRHDQIFARPDYARYAPTRTPIPIVDDDAMELGQLYRSSAILGAGADLPAALRPDQWAGQPGTRAPHVWVSKDGARCSTLDLVQPGWVLLTSDERWCAPAQAAAGQVRIGLACVVVGDPATADPTSAAASPLDLPIARIMAAPPGKAALEIHLSQILGHPGYDTFKSMSLRQLLPLSQGQLTEEALDAVAEDLAAVHFAPEPSAPVDPDAFGPDAFGPDAFGKAFGVGPSGASLIRPDGYIAWRIVEAPANAAPLLADVLRRLAFAGADRCP